MNKITDIAGSKNIGKNTPLISIEISWDYLIPTKYRNIYNVDIKKIHDQYKKINQYITNFISIGMIDGDIIDDKQTFKIILANFIIIPTTKLYEKLSPGSWYGYVKHGSYISKSLGVILSEKKPQLTIPVFPRNLLIQIDPQQDSNSYPIYSDEQYGYWTINKYKFMNLHPINNEDDILADMSEDILADMSTDMSADMSTDMSSDMSANISMGKDENESDIGLILTENKNPWYLNKNILKKFDLKLSDKEIDNNKKTDKNGIYTMSNFVKDENIIKQKNYDNSSRIIGSKRKFYNDSIEDYKEGMDFSYSPSPRKSENHCNDANINNNIIIMIFILLGILFLFRIMRK
jgi:hypothetical protein